MTDYYKVLGLEQGASLEEVRKAYREYAAHFHPDKHGGSEFFKKRFQEIQEAYEYLTQSYEESETKTALQTSSKEENRQAHFFANEIVNSGYYQKWKEQTGKVGMSMFTLFVILLGSGALLFYIMNIIAETRIGEMIGEVIGGWIILIMIGLPFALAFVPYILKGGDYGRVGKLELIFRRNDGQYVIYNNVKFRDAGGSYYSPNRYELEKYLTTLTVKIEDNSVIPIISYMQGGGKIEVIYFINRKKIGIDIFDFPN